MTKKIMLLVFLLVWTAVVPAYAFSSPSVYIEPSSEDIQEWIIDSVRLINKSFINLKLAQKNAQQDEKAIKILTIGNSFSQDIDYYLYDIAKSANVDVIVGNLYNSGCSFERHWSYASKNEGAYSYYKWKSGKLTKVEYSTMKRAILDEDWDYITFQQSSAHSGLYDTYQPHLNKLVSYVKGNAKNEDVKFALNMTWAYSSQSTNDGFFNYNYNQETMYKSIVNSYKYASQESKIKLVVPCGTAIQNARTDKSLKAVGKELTSDGYHLNSGLGRYIAGLTMFYSIVKEENLDLDLINDVKFVPDSKDITEKLVNLAKKSAVSAVQSPYAVKSIK